MRGTLADFDADLEVGGKPARIDGLRVRFGADGIADHRDIAPLFPRANAVEFAGFTLSNVFASVRATERSYLVTEAGADCCGGELRLYSLFLDPEKLSAGATVFADGIDAGQVLSRLACFRGQASGRLHGKMPFFLKGGRELRIKKTHIMLAAAAVCAAGCIQVKTESETKPIHITMDVNLKVDKDLDKAFADEDQQKPKGDFKAIKEMVDRQAAGITNRAMLEERTGATDDDRILIADENAKRMKRFRDVAKENGTTIEVVQKRYAAKMREKIPVGAWYQDDSGKWLQRK